MSGREYLCVGGPRDGQTVKLDDCWSCLVVLERGPRPQVSWPPPPPNEAVFASLQEVHYRRRDVRAEGETITVLAPIDMPIADVMRALIINYQPLRPAR